MDVFEYIKGLMAIIGVMASISRFIKWYRNRGPIKVWPECNKKTFNLAEIKSSVVGHKEYKYGDTVEPVRKITRYGCSNCGASREST